MYFVINVLLNSDLTFCFQMDILLFESDALL